MATLDEGQNNNLYTLENQLDNLEQLLDLIANELIISSEVDIDDVAGAQKFILNGQLQQGGGVGVLALFQKDIKANQEDLVNSTTVVVDGEIIQQNLQEIANNVDFDTLQITIQPGLTISIEDSHVYVEGLPITDLVIGDGNPLNVSQFIPIDIKQSIIDVDKANEYLDTNIYELLPAGDTRQARITRLFQELNALLPPNIPNFDADNDGAVDRDENADWINAEQYSQDNSISYAQDNQDGNIDEEDAFIHRLKKTANDTNSTKTIQDIYNTITPYLDDIIFGETALEDISEYKNKSSGYLKFRNLNQGIIIRNTNQDFVEGLNPNNPTWLTNNYTDFLTQLDNPAKTNFILNNPGTGFTITMWVKFLDKVSQGTLFNYGNPTRDENPFGFKLETFVLNKDDIYDNGSGILETFGDFIARNGYHRDTLGLFKNTDVERFVRLQVREFGDFITGTDEGLRDSALGMGDINKFQFNPPDLNKNQFGNYYSDDERRIVNYTNIPENFNEWYFICASYNPAINELGSDFGNTDADYWLNHLTDGGEYVANSNLGNKCKVEIISRADLLRARGFKV